MKGSLVVAMCLVGSLVACSSPDQGPQARTYYESLDLSSPLSAAEVFVEAYDGDDFMTVWLVLDHSAQRQWRESLNLLQYGPLIRWNEELHDDLTNRYSDLVLESADYWFIFDQVMLIADQHDSLLIDLQPVSLTLRGIEADGGATVIGEFEGIDGEVTIDLNQTPRGNWRVHQVLVPGGDPASVPWGVAVTDS